MKCEYCAEVKVWTEGPEGEDEYMRWCDGNRIFRLGFVERRSGDTEMYLAMDERHHAEGEFSE